MKTIYWKDALKDLEKNKNKEIIFNDETIHWKDAMIFGKAGIKVPLELIDHEEEKIKDDENIQISEQKNIMKSVMLMLTKENYDFIVENEINLSELINQYIQTKLQKI